MFIEVQVKSLSVVSEVFNLLLNTYAYLTLY